MRRRFSSGQGLTEFALVLPVILLLVLGTMDLGRAIFYYLGVSETVGEGARWATLSPNGEPSNATVLAAVTAQAPYVSLAPCPNGPIPADFSAAGLQPTQGWLYVTAPPGGNTDGANAPGGETGSAGAGCTAIAPAKVGDRLQVTIVYMFSPITPVIRQVVGSRFVLSSSSIFTVER